MPGILCEHCTGHCCRYIALPIETPTDRRDFDDIRWYLLHEGINVFVEEGEWYINIPTNCRHLQPDYRCGIYETRPRICREYSTDNCDYHSGDYGWEQHFTCPEHLDEFVTAYFAAARRKRAAKKPGRRLNGAKRLKVKLKTRRRRRALDYSAATTDVRGVPLPVLQLPS
jgi:Fe-S-cluster containining protein